MLGENGSSCFQTVLCPNVNRKQLIRNQLMSGCDPVRALERANAQLCSENPHMMFVTVWLGILDLQDGRLEFANAAHNPPLLKKDGEPFMYMDYKKYRRGLVLGGLAEVRYSNNEIYLSPGDVLFLYTDGVTEAVNHDIELYGENRLLKCMEGNYGMEPELLLRAVRRDIEMLVCAERHLYTYICEWDR